MKLPQPQASALPFGALPVYSSDEVRLWNWFCRTFANVEDWRGWFADIFSRVLATQAGLKLTIIQSHRSQPGSIESTFDQTEVRLGRGEENELSLSGASISKHHGRLFFRDNTYFVEDLGSLLGTYLNGKKLVPHEATKVRSGDQIVIFPHVFTMKIVPVWAPESNVQIHIGAITPAAWRDFLEDAPVGFANFFLTAYPNDNVAGLQIDRSFVHAILDRALTPLGVPSSPGGASDTAVLELLVLGILQNANKRLAYPFQFALTPRRNIADQDRQVRGLTILVTLALSDVSGSFRIFLPYRFLAGMSEGGAAGNVAQLAGSITWAFQVSAGTLTLTMDEVRHLEPGDAVLFDSKPQILFPTDFKRGWNISFDEGNFSTAKLDKSFEGETIVVDQGPNKEMSERLDMSSLPVSLHVIVGEKELTLSEVNGLAPGTILDLKRDLSNVVRLALNGKIVGQGQLVEIDGKLAVRIGKWGA
jgi:type III secretion system YscQ/HrcQ family protein